MTPPAFGLALPQVFPAGGFLERVQAVAHELAGRAPLALARMKANLNDAERMDFASHLDLEAARQSASVTSADAVEAAAAFLEKRPPAFSGR